ncbi:MAG: carboxylating nicotinate-nucleotide diphosphorylase [Bacteroidales bacterium]|nr:carboxylating nicotinate-nucleotide diphosphorylase [Bacteroidales bacterium]
MNIDEIIDEAFQEDIGDGDHTSLSTIPRTAFGKAKLIIKEEGILAGIKVAEKVFKKANSNLEFEIFIQDGSTVKKGDIVFFVKGQARSILSAERLALNFMQRMSGIATYTHKLSNKIKGFKTKLLDTRKTTPLLRELEKYAVRMGGGENHRMGLYDMIMIKDNHIDFAGGIENAIDATNKYLSEKGKELKIEIEVRNFSELHQVLDHGGINRIMLDNFSPADLKKAIDLIDGNYETEASGGINIETIKSYAETGVDYISVGALTHQIQSLDMSLVAIE